MYGGAHVMILYGQGERDDWLKAEWFPNRPLLPLPLLHIPPFPFLSLPLLPLPLIFLPFLSLPHLPLLPFSLLSLPLLPFSLLPLLPLPLFSCPGMVSWCLHVGVGLHGLTEDCVLFSDSPA